MNNVFISCTEFNQPLAWVTSKVKTMRKMFFKCPKFNQQLKWDTRAAVDMDRMFCECTALDSVMEFDMRNVAERDGMFEGCRPGARVIDVGMAARLAELDMLDLLSGDKEVEDDDPDECGLCVGKKARVRINHDGRVGESGSHSYCGACIHSWITTKWSEGQEATCPTCRTKFELSDLQKTEFGRYARKACGHKRRADDYRKLHRVGLADAHDARAREYALGAARVLGVTLTRT